MLRRTCAVWRLLDHLVGGREQCRRNVQTQSSRRLEINDKLDSGDLLHGQFGRLLTFEDAAHVNAGQMMAPENVRSIADETASRDVFIVRVEGGHSVAGGSTAS
jgi:hypothetical protein